jgi:hypothetical protein
VALRQTLHPSWIEVKTYFSIQRKKTLSIIKNKIVLQKVKNINDSKITGDKNTA